VARHGQQVFQVIPVEHGRAPWAMQSCNPIMRIWALWRTGRKPRLGSNSWYCKPA
jgi:hypothetical protein